MRQWGFHSGFEALNPAFYLSVGIDHQIMKNPSQNLTLLWVIRGENLTKVGNSVTLLHSETVRCLSSQAALDR